MTRSFLLALAAVALFHLPAGAQYPDADYQVGSGGIATVRRNADGGYTFTDEFHRVDSHVRPSADGTFKAWGIGGSFTLSGQQVTWPGNSWSAITGTFIVASNEGVAKVTRNPNGTYRFEDEYGRVHAEESISWDGTLKPYGIPAKIAPNGYTWPGNAWLRIAPIAPPPAPVAVPQSEGDIAAKGNLTIRVANQSAHAILIVMDTERERYKVAAGGAATFHPNLGDNPTYHVYEVIDGRRGRKLWSESFNTVSVGGIPPLPRVGGDLKWTGGRLERD
jgi:hypothetical protein